MNLRAEVEVWHGRSWRDGAPAAGWRKGRRKMKPRREVRQSHWQTPEGVQGHVAVSKKKAEWLEPAHSKEGLSEDSIWQSFPRCCSLAYVSPTESIPVPSLIWASLLPLPNSVQTHSMALRNTALPLKPLPSSLSMSSKFSSSSGGRTIPWRSCGNWLSWCQVTQKCLELEARVLGLNKPLLLMWGFLTFTTKVQA